MAAVTATVVNGITEVGEEKEKAHENDPELCQESTDHGTRVQGRTVAPT